MLLSRTTTRRLGNGRKGTRLPRRVVAKTPRYPYRRARSVRKAVTSTKQWWSANKVFKNAGSLSNSIALPRRITWLSNVIPTSITGIEEEVAKSIEVIENPPAWMCLQCRGAKLLCGKPRCPIIVKAQSIARMGASIETDRIDGASPPGVLVGRLGYPRVSIGPMVPPQHGDTSILDTPEEWLGKPIEKIVDYRYSLVRGNARASVDDAKSPSRPS